MRRTRSPGNGRTRARRPCEVPTTRHRPGAKLGLAARWAPAQSLRVRVRGAGESTAVELLAGGGEVARSIAGVGTLGAEDQVRTWGGTGHGHGGHAELRVRPSHLCSPSRHSRPGTNSSKGGGGWAAAVEASPPPRSPAPPAGAGMAVALAVAVGGGSVWERSSWVDGRRAPRLPSASLPSGLLRPPHLRRGGEWPRTTAKKWVSGVFPEGENRGRGARAGAEIWECPGPLAGTPPEAPLTPCIPASPEARRTRPRCSPSGNTPLQLAVRPPARGIPPGGSVDLILSGRHGVQGCLGRRSSPGTWLSPRSLPPRAPLAPCFHRQLVLLGPVDARHFPR